MGSGTTALSALEKAIEADRTALSSSKDRLISLAKRKNKGIAACGLRALVLLSPSVLEELAPDFISKWRTTDEATARLFWQLLDRLPMQVLQQSAENIYARMRDTPRVLEAERMLQKLSGTEVMAVEEHGDGRVAFVLTLRCTDDGGVEQSVWLGECVSKDPSLQDFTTKRFAEDPSRPDHTSGLDERTERQVYRSAPRLETRGGDATRCCGRCLPFPCQDAVC